MNSGTNSTLTPDFDENCQNLTPTTTVAASESSLSFFDAIEDVSPDQPSSTPVDTTVNTPGTENSSPIGQQLLFPSETDVGNNNNTYLTQLHNHLLVLDMHLVTEEALEEGDGDSNCSAAELEELESSMQSANKERIEVLIKMEDDTDKIIIDSPKNCILTVKGLGEEVALSKAPDNWTPKAPNKAAGEPELAAIDNPGKWDMYTYRPKSCSKAKKDFKKGQYIHHALPTGARPVPADDRGHSQANGWLGFPLSKMDK
jgi:hypothetical protein